MSQSNGNGSSTSIRVEIYDQSYHLRGTDPQYIADLAEYVDTKMRLISQQAATVESLKVAVLAALNIADELHVLKRKYDSLTADYTDQGRTSFRRARRGAGRDRAASASRPSSRLARGVPTFSSPTLVIPNPIP